MFKITNEIHSDEGFEVKFINTEFILGYSEGNRKLQVSVDMTGTGYVLFTKTIKEWEPPFSSDIIDNVKRDEIVRNITRALNFDELTVRIDDTRDPLNRAPLENRFPIDRKIP